MRRASRLLSQASCRFRSTRTASAQSRQNFQDVANPARKRDPPRARLAPSAPRKIPLPAVGRQLPEWPRLAKVNARRVLKVDDMPPLPIVGERELDPLVPSHGTYRYSPANRHGHETYQPPTVSEIMSFRNWGHGSRPRHDQPCRDPDALSPCAANLLSRYSFMAVRNLA